MSSRFFQIIILFSLQLLCSFTVFSQELYDPIAVYLTWQRKPDTTMTIQWITLHDHPKDSVAYHAAADSFWQYAEGSHTYTPEGQHYLIHRVELTDLRPQTDYYFRIEANGKIYKFQTMPNKAVIPIRFVVGGDIYHDGIDRVIETNRHAAAVSPMFALVGGDLAYGGDKESLLPNDWQSWMERTFLGVDRKTEMRQRWIDWLATWKTTMITPEGRLIPMIPALGNHDVNGGFDKTSTDAAFFHAFFPFPGTQGYNALDFGNYLSLIVLDTGHTNPVGGKQTRWLYETLRGRQHIRNKFALYHVPAYPSVRKFNGKISTAVRNFWVPIFEKYEILATFEHHDHAYKRTYPLKGNKVAANGGILYFGDGAWGVEKPRQPVADKEHWYIEKSAPQRHFIMVTLNQDRCHFAAVDSQGQIFDQTQK